MRSAISFLAHFHFCVFCCRYRWKAECRPDFVRGVLAEYIFFLHDGFPRSCVQCLKRYLRLMFQAAQLEKTSTPSAIHSSAAASSKISMIIFFSFHSFQFSFAVCAAARQALFQTAFFPELEARFLRSSAVWAAVDTEDIIPAPDHADFVFLLQAPSPPSLLQSASFQGCPGRSSLPSLRPPALPTRRPCAS